ncbi:MAG: anti-sigma factor [Patescibacteria group bacterium]
MKIFAISFLAFMLLLGAGCRDSSQDEGTQPVIDRNSILLEARENGLIMDDAEIAAMAAAQPEIDQEGRSVEDVQGYLKTNVKDWWSAALADVTGGDGYGIAHATLKTGSFTLIAQMGNLPEPASEYYYEVWIVRREDSLAVLSLGRAQKTENGYALVYLTDTDLSDHDFFVLTLESNDGNPSPGEHILEGILK